MTIQIILRLSSGDVPVGAIHQTSSGETKFVFEDSYIRLGPGRPLLSLRWLDVKGEERTLIRMRHPADKIGRRGVLPSWFSGLLPEGALRQLVEAEIGPGRHGEDIVLGRLGNDLPGAVVAMPVQGSQGSTSLPLRARHGRIQFSLAGVQMKFTANLVKDRVTFPALGLGGDYIAKTTSKTVPEMVEAEHTGMMMSRLLGVRTADSSLVLSEKVDGVPEEYLQYGKYVFLSRRFDRCETGRVHMEDFAQIADALGDQKYFFGNLETCLNLIRRFSASPENDVWQALRRLVNDVLIGNGDAHLKNWSFVHGPEGSRLSPAYDIVPSGAWGDDKLALELAGHKTMSLVSLNRFRRIGKYLGFEDVAVQALVQEMVEGAHDLWPTVEVSTDVGNDVRDRLISRLQSLRLVRDLRPAAFVQGFATEEADDVPANPKP